MIINRAHARVVSADLLVEKHFHAAPFAFVRRRLLNFPTQGVNELAYARGFQGQVGANQSKWWSLLTEHRAGTKRSDNFIVAHINYPNIGTRDGAITGNG